MASHRAWGWLPIVSMINGCGLLLFAVADNGGRGDALWATPLFWLSLVILVAPTTLRLGAQHASRQERLGLVFVLGMALYLVKVLRDPLEFSYFDELEMWPVPSSILRTGHLFHPDPLSVVDPFYPGLQIVVSALAQLGRVSIFHAGLIVIGVARAVLTIALFLLYERISRSARVAGLATLIYMANPNFLFFDAEFGYESLSLAIAALTLVIAVEVVEKKRADTWNRFLLPTIAILGIAVLVVTHHLTSYAVLSFFGLWSLILIAKRPGVRKLAHAGLQFYAGETAGIILAREAPVKTPNKTHLRERNNLSRVAYLASISLVSIIFWNVLVARVTVQYLEPPLSNAFSQFWGLLTAQTAGKAPFSGAAGQVQLWDSINGYLSIILILAVLPISFFHIWRRYRHNALALVLIALACTYPVSLGLRLTPAGTETSNRSSEFIFVGVAFVLAVGLVKWWLPQRKDFLGRASRRVIFTVGTTILFIGGTCIGTAPSARLPGPFLVGADQRSVDSAGVGAADWALAHLGPNNRIAADRMNQELMGAYGEQNPIRVSPRGVDTSNLFFSLDFSPIDRYLVETSRIAYVEVDRRLTSSLPMVGYYFDSDESPHKIPLPLADLIKFDQTSGISRVFDSGAVSIYDVTSVNTCVSRRIGQTQCDPRIPDTPSDKQIPSKSAATPIVLDMLRSLAALLLVAVLPGWTLVNVLSLPTQLEGFWKLGLILGLSLLVVILAGLILNLTTWGLHADSWAVLLGGIVLGGAARLLATRKSTTGVLYRRVGFTNFRRLGPVIASLPAVALAVAAFGLSSWGAANAQRHEVRYTQFWLSPTALNSNHMAAALGIYNVRAQTTHYEVRISESGSDRLIQEWSDIILKPGETWQTRFAASLEGSGRLTADLYLMDSPQQMISGTVACGSSACSSSPPADVPAGSPYREVFIWHN